MEFLILFNLFNNKNNFFFFRFCFIKELVLGKLFLFKVFINLCLKIFMLRVEIFILLK